MDLKEFSYEDFKIEQLDELVALAIESFELNNAFSKAGLESREELDFRIRASVQLFLQAQEKFNEKYKTDRPAIKVTDFRCRFSPTRARLWPQLWLAICIFSSQTSSRCSIQKTRTSRSSDIWTRMIILEDLQCFQV